MSVVCVLFTSRNEEGFNDIKQSKKVGFIIKEWVLSFTNNSKSGIVYKSIDL